MKMNSMKLVKEEKCACLEYKQVEVMMNFAPQLILECTACGNLIFSEWDLKHRESDQDNSFKSVQILLKNQIKTVN